MNLTHQNNPLLLKQQLGDTLLANQPKPLDAILDTKVIISRLTNNLMHLFNITDGDHLRFILGYGQCSHNKKAMQYWVIDQLSEYQDDGDVLSYLVKQLQNQLMIEVSQ